jgi:hypothetical protein
MNSSELKTVAAELAEAGAPGLPTIVLIQELPLFEVEFAALEFAEEASLPASDWAVLALTKALGEATPADIDGYLGLGEAVSEGLQRRLLDDALLEERGAGAEPSVPPAADTGLGAFFRRLLGGRATPIEAPKPRIRAITNARKLCDSRASATPVCVLSPRGMQALERGAVAQRRVRPARLLFLAEPLLYLGTVDEKRHRYTQHRRPRPLEPEQVPEPLRLLDTTLSLPAEERVSACGIDSGVRGFAGQLVGIVPGAQWEVRPLVLGQRGRRNDGRQGGADHQTALLILAAFMSSDDGGVRWRAYVQQQGQVQDCPHIDATRFLDAPMRSVASLLSTIEAEGLDLPSPTALRGDGAFELRCNETILSRLLGEADRPDDTFLPAVAPSWWVGLRAHAQPIDASAARSAFYEFLGRRDAELRRDFDATCSAVAAGLLEYWDADHSLPSADDAAQHLWIRPELRAALCMRRLRADLVEPYIATELSDER